jgi:hypothetical protein
MEFTGAALQPAGRRPHGCRRAKAGAHVPAPPRRQLLGGRSAPAAAAPAKVTFAAAPRTHPADTSNSTSHTSPSLQRRPTPLLGSQLPSASLDPTMQMSWPKCTR